MIDWTCTVNELSPRLYRYFLACFAPDVSEELVQEVLVRLVRGWKAGSYDATKGSLAMWAFGIAHNIRLETLRVLKKETGFAALSKDASEEENHTSEEFPHDLNALRKAISNLSEIESQVVLLHIDDFLTLSEISHLLDIPIGTIKSHIHRAKENLKRLLGETKKEPS